MLPINTKHTQNSPMGYSDKITSLLAYFKYEETHLKCKTVGTPVYTWRKAPRCRKRGREPLVYTRASRLPPLHTGTPKIFCSCHVELPSMKMFEGHKTKGQLVAPEIYKQYCRLLVTDTPHQWWVSLKYYRDRTKHVVKILFITTNSIKI
jgi:hypothetical protein